MHQGIEDSQPFHASRLDSAHSASHAPGDGLDTSKGAVLAKTFRLLGDASHAAQDGKVVFGLADKDVVVERLGSICCLEVFPYLGGRTTRFASRIPEHRYTINLFSGECTPGSAAAPPVAQILDPIVSGQTVIKPHCVRSFSYTDPHTGGGILSASVALGQHTPGYCLDELRVACSANPLKALVMDGVTGRDGRALLDGKLNVESRSYLAGGYVVDYLPDIILRRFAQQPALTHAAPALNIKQEFKWSNALNLTSVAMWLCPDGLSERLAWDSFVLDFGPIDKDLFYGIKDLSPEQIAAAIKFRDYALAAQTIVRALDVAVEEYSPLFQQHFPAVGGLRLKGSAALAGALDLPHGERAIFSCADCWAAVVDGDKVIAHTMPFNPRNNIACTIGAETFNGKTAPVRTRELSLRMIPKDLNDPVIVLGSDGCYAALEALSRLARVCAESREELKPLLIEQALRQNSDFFVQTCLREAPDFRTDDRTVVAFRPGRLHNLFSP